MRDTRRAVPAPDRAAVLVNGVVAVITGVVVGACGTLVHRWETPAGLVLALLLVLSGGVFARAAGGGALLLLHGFVAVATTLALTFAGPGGDVLVTDQPLGYAWLLGLVVALVAVAPTPRSWYAETPLGRRGA
ncbi:DUF6113 family protein [Georgenia sp. TF02-10]|uniref:DUF6113 family protein n=1 Tax=Georgenia sp. TF02-10 TaxID=2917725 RepID=UPI001FA6E5ED|nr:DUF6113 family protein [Georgenia sp. TF02-10]UNX55669.1 DUF6113 family protein [Georgenia sp. TF02-10]